MTKESISERRQKYQDFILMMAQKAGLTRESIVKHGFAPALILMEEEAKARGVATAGVDSRIAGFRQQIELLRKELTTGVPDDFLVTLSFALIPLDHVEIDEIDGLANDAWICGFALGLLTGSHDESAHKMALTEMARRGANVRHAENHAMKQDAINAYRAGSFKSKDDAAEQIAKTVVPVKLRTVREWLKGVNKSN